MSEDPTEKPKLNMGKNICQKMKKSVFIHFFVH